MGAEIYFSDRSFHIRPLKEGGAPQLRAMEGPTHIQALDDATPTIPELYKLGPSQPTFFGGPRSVLVEYPKPF